MGLENTHIWTGKTSLKEVNRLAKLYSRSSGYPLSDYFQRGNTVYWRYLRVHKGRIIGTDHPKNSRGITEKDL